MSTESKKKSARRARVTAPEIKDRQHARAPAYAIAPDGSKHGNDVGTVRRFLAELDVPIPFDELARELDDRDASISRESLANVIADLEHSGEIIRNRRGAFGLSERMDLVRGKVLAHRDGYGFLVPETGGADVFLSPRQMRGVMHGDRALISVVGYDNRGRSEGAVVEVIERATKRLVGTFEREAEVCFVVPDNSRIRHDILIPSHSAGLSNRSQEAIALDGVKRGSIVVVEIDQYPTKRTRASGHLVEVLGEHMTPGMEIDVAIRAHDLPSEFSQPALDEAARCGDSVLDTQISGRLDMRHLPLVTIDGEDARDFDDAVYCEARANGWRLWVAIADVSAYVLPGSILDEEAQLRGNSVYFPNRVLPMLPEALSNGLCSLNPGVDRLCMVCELSIDSSGTIKRSRFHEGVMRSRARLTYSEVAKIIQDRDPDARTYARELTPHLDELYKLYAALRQARESRGALDLDTVETYIIFDRDNRVSEIRARVRNDAHKLIEECMIAANVAAARFVQRHKLPALYRVHEGPKQERLELLRAFLDSLGLRLGGGANPQPEHYRVLLAALSEDPRLPLVQTMLLRSLAQAVYRPENLGHFGLGLPAYAHFTSPIRRYADLLLHRVIRAQLHRQASAASPVPAGSLARAGTHISMTERRADEATRDAVSWLKCEFMLDKVGQTYTGTVSAVTSFGLFVTLDELFVDGLVHVSALGRDYFHFDPASHTLQGRRSGARFALADRLDVNVVRVDLDERKIDFEPAIEQHTEQHRVGSGRKRTGTRGERAARRGAGRGRSRRGQ